MNLSRLKRPLPPPDLTSTARSPLQEKFVPDAALSKWLFNHFIAPDGQLFRVEHKHLKFAQIGCVWTNAPLKLKGNAIAATAEMPSVQGNAWARARFSQQLREWFGVEPDFLLTFYAPECAKRDDASFCALCRHELLHCGQKRDREGALRFDKDGLPCFCIRGHDVEEFNAVVEDFGVSCCGERAIEFARLARRSPLIAPARIALACGRCLK